MDETHFGPAEAFDGGGAHIGGVEPYLYVWYDVPLRKRKEPKDAKRDLLDEFDRRASSARAEATEQVASRLPSQPPRPKRKRRTKQEMAEARAREAERAARVAAEVEPEWLRGQSEELDEFVERIQEET